MQSQRKYISTSGDVGTAQGGWSVGSIPSMFWGFVNGIGTFFSTMISDEATQAYVNRSTGATVPTYHSLGGSAGSYLGGSGGRGQPGRPRIGGFNSGGSSGLGSVPMAGGG